MRFCDVPLRLSTGASKSCAAQISRLPHVPNGSNASRFSSLVELTPSRVATVAATSMCHRCLSGKDVAGISRYKMVEEAPRPSRVRHVAILTLTMTLNSTTSDSSSILSGGKLKPGIYKIQNLSAQTYMDVHEHLREVCCRPATALGEGRGVVRLSIDLHCVCLTIRSGKSNLSGLDTPCGG